MPHPLPVPVGWGTGVEQELTAGSCASACPEHACYDGSYAGPWPSRFVDESVEIRNNFV